MTRFRSILFVELLGGLGDLLLALPAIHALGRSHPRARITVLTFAPGTELLTADPHVAEVVNAEPGPPEAQREAVARLADRGFDLIVSDTRYGGIPGVLLASSAEVVVDDLWRQPPTGQRIDLRFLALLADDGLVDPEFRRLPPSVFLTRPERAAAAAAVGGPAALLLPEAGMTIKEWAPEHFRALALRLAADGLTVLATAGRDAGLAMAAVRDVPGARVLEKGGLRQFAALAAACQVVVAGDTGPGRLAAAVGTPTVALYGPTWARRFGLRPGHASLQSPLPCDVRDPANMTEQSCWYSGRCVFPDRRTCVDDHSVDDVYAAARGVMAARRASLVLMGGRTPALAG